MYCDCPCHYSSGQMQACEECAPRHRNLPPGAVPIPVYGPQGGSGQAPEHYWLPLSWEMDGTLFRLKEIVCGDCGITKRIGTTT